MVAGLVRGFTGFGTGMVVAPVVSSFYSIEAALVIIFFIDGIPALPAVVPEFKKCQWRELLLCIFGSALAIPIGISIVTLTDQTPLRWVIAIVIFVTVAALWSGYIYKGPRGKFISIFVGSFSGILGTTAALPGPPVILYWMASKLPAFTVRANTMVFLFLIDIIIGLALIFAGMVTLQFFTMAVAVAPIYLLGLLIGGRLFGFASEQTYRNFAFIVILLTAILSLPILDALFSR
ncbi:MAG: sulfite exporter TauE/SafE family protein [Nitratireductor sp.]